MKAAQRSSGEHFADGIDYRTRAVDDEVRRNTRVAVRLVHCSHVVQRSLGQTNYTATTPVTMRMLRLACLGSALACTSRELAHDSVQAHPPPSADTTQRPEGSTAPWDDARSRGVDFRAIGQEPGWIVEIDADKSIYVLADYGEKKLTAPASAPRDSADVIIYEATIDAHDLTIRIQPLPCADAMSGERMTHTVTLTLDGKQYQGCGRRLTP